ncbi:MAG: hypothetical protein ACOYJG_12725 [Prevotella sp.]|jgi:hypothetical protein
MLSLNIIATPLNTNTSGKLKDTLIPKEKNVIDLCHIRCPFAIGSGCGEVTVDDIGRDMPDFSLIGAMAHLADFTFKVHLYHHRLMIQLETSVAHFRSHTTMAITVLMPVKMDLIIAFSSAYLSLPFML